MSLRNKFLAMFASDPQPKAWARKIASSFAAGERHERDRIKPEMMADDYRMILVDDLSHIRDQLSRIIDQLSKE